MKPDDATLKWLLEEDNPSVRYFALTGLLGKPASDPAVASAKKAIKTTGPVPAMLAKQEAGGYWGVEQDFYIRAKYKGTVWTIIVLAELGADISDPRVRQAGEFILSHAQDKESGGFAYLPGPGGGGDHEKIIPCLSGNMVFSLIRFGMLDDPRVQQGIEWLTRYMRFDDKDGPAPKGWPYWREPCWGRHTCMMAVAKGLKALAEIPPKKRNAAVRRTISNCAEFILKHHVYRRSHDPSRIAKPVWTDFGFPLMAGTDAVEMLGLLADLGYRDARMEEAIDLVKSKRGADGRWLTDKSLNQRLLVRLETDGKPSKWVTLKALRALRRVRRLTDDGIPD